MQADLEEIKSDIVYFQKECDESEAKINRFEGRKEELIKDLNKHKVKTIKQAKRKVSEIDVEIVSAKKQLCVLHELILKMKVEFE